LGIVDPLPKAPSAGIASEAILGVSAGMADQRGIAEGSVIFRPVRAYLTNTIGLASRFCLADRRRPIDTCIHNVWGQPVGVEMTGTP